jgi:hypothetical protein
MRPFTDESPACIEHALINCLSISGQDETSSLVTDRAGASGSDRNVMKLVILVDILLPFLSVLVRARGSKMVVRADVEANILSPLRERKNSDVTNTIQKLEVRKRQTSFATRRERSFRFFTFRASHFKSERI